MSKARDPKFSEAFAENLKSAYLQGYQDGVDGKSCDPGTIVTKGREHLFGYAYLQGWGDGGEDAADKGVWTS